MTTSSPSSSQTLLPRGDDDRSPIDISALFGTLWRGKWIIALTAFIGILLGGYQAYYVATPYYTSTAVVMLNPREEQIVDLENVIGGLSSTDSSVVNTEVQVLRSRSLIGKLVDRLDLTTDPEFNTSLRPASFSNRLKARIREILGEEKAVATAAMTEDRERRVRALTIDKVLGALSVRNISQSLVFEVTMHTEDPQKSALMADTLVELYILNQLEVKFDATEQATSWLTDRVGELQTELEQAEAKVKEFNSGTDLINQQTLEALERQLKELRDRIDNSTLTQQALDARLSAMQQASTPAEKVEATSDPQLERMLPRVGSDEDIAAAFNTRFEQLLLRLQADVARGASQLTALTNSRDELDAQINRQSADLITLQQLTREAEASRLLYEYFLSRLKETAAQKGIQQADSRVLSEAVVARGPSEPRKSLILMISTLLGAMVGAALVLFREMRNNTFHTAREMEMATQYPVMGQIPLLPARRRRDAIAYLAEKPTSVSAEAFRNLRTSLLLSNVDHPPQITMVTSSFPGDGKTTISLALAQNLTGMGKRVLLIEGDIRRRIFTQYLKTEKPGGLVSVITGECQLEDALIHNAESLGCDVLLGEKSSANAADIFASERFANLMSALRERYDHIIIDTPPVLVVPDARVLAQVCDAVLFVVKWDGTPRPHVLESLHMFESVNVPVSGMVLNQINPRGMRRYGYGKYGYGAYSGYGYARKYYNN